MGQVGKREAVQPESIGTCDMDGTTGLQSTGLKGLLLLVLHGHS